jgi:photosystem II stability/assembly factor-like uncharacterized protein
MKTIFYLLAFLLAASNVFAQLGWVRQTSGTTQNLNDVSFVNSNTGYASGSYIPTGPGSSDSGYVLKTVNGGTTWTIILKTTYPISRVIFHNANEGVYLSPNGIYGTTNGGITWLPKYAGLASYKFIQFLDKDNTKDSIVISGRFFTSNGGVTWETKGGEITGGSYGTDVKYSSWTTGYSISFGYANKSINSGISWEEAIPAAVNLNLWSLDIDGNSRAIVGGESDVWWTTNNGSDWQHTAWGILYGHRLVKLKYTSNAGTFALSNKGGIFNSLNYGSSWSAQISGDTTQLNNICFVDQYTGWIVGNAGIILKTTTGGLTPSGIENPNATPNNFSLKQNYPNPFNPGTTINYSLPASDFVALTVYDALGNEVRTLVSERQNAGNYSLNFNAASLPSGIYFYKLLTTNFSEVRKMTLVK